MWVYDLRTVCSTKCSNFVCRIRIILRDHKYYSGNICGPSVFFHLIQYYDVTKTTHLYVSHVQRDKHVNQKECTRWDNCSMWCEVEEQESERRQYLLINKLLTHKYSALNWPVSTVDVRCPSPSIQFYHWFCLTVWQLIRTTLILLTCHAKNMKTNSMNSPNTLYVVYMAIVLLHRLSAASNIFQGTAIQR